jgi:hypothetical protein
MNRFFTPAMVVACLALAVALGGTAYAVAKLPPNSVGTRQVINHSLLRADFARGTLLRGPRGQRGAIGPSGPTGIPVGSVTFRGKGGAISPTAGVGTTVITSCPEGTQVLYGGFRVTVPVYVRADEGSGADWTVSLQSSGVAGSLYVTSACVKT